MKLRQYLEYEENVTVYREVPVGRTLTIGGRPALIVALREVGIPENDGRNALTVAICSRDISKVPAHRTAL